MMMGKKQIYITEFDYDRLEGLLERSRNSNLDGYLDALRAELDPPRWSPRRESRPT